MLELQHTCICPACWSCSRGRVAERAPPPFLTSQESAEWLAGWQEVVGDLEVRLVGGVAYDGGKVGMLQLRQGGHLPMLAGTRRAVQRRHIHVISTCSRTYTHTLTHTSTHTKHEQQGPAARVLNCQIRLSPKSYSHSQPPTETFLHFHSLTHSPTHTPSHSFTHHTPTHPLTHSLTHSLTHPPTY